MHCEGLQRQADESGPVQALAALQRLSHHARKDTVPAASHPALSGQTAAILKGGAAQPPLRMASPLIGLNVYPRVGGDMLGDTVQARAMPAADYVHWQRVMQRRGVMHGAAAAGRTTVVAQLSKHPVQMIGWPSMRQATALLLLLEGVLTCGASLAAFVITGGVGWFPALLGYLAGAAKIIRAAIAWPSSDGQGGVEDVTWGWTVAKDVLFGIEAGLALWGGIVLTDAAAIKRIPIITFAAIKLLRFAVQVLQDILKHNDMAPGFQTFLGYTATALQFLEAAALVVAGSGGIHAAEGLSDKLGGAAAITIGASKGVRGAMMGAKTRDDQKNRADGPRETDPLLSTAPVSTVIDIETGSGSDSD